MDLTSQPNPQTVLGLSRDLVWLGAGWSLLIGMLLSLTYLGRHSQSKRYSHTGKNDAPVVSAVEPLESFSWRETEPRKFRPFKPVYNITMALRSDDPSDLIVIDRNYLNRVNVRRNLIANKGSTVHGCLPGGEDAVQELYAFLLGHYLPTRYPTMFELSPDKKRFFNLVTGHEHPTTPPPEDASAALRVMGETVEDDMFLLHQTPEGHVTKAFMCCFPAGFDPSEKLGKLLKDVHGPVPSYEKIGASMERFFSKLQVGHSFKRTNWSVQTHGELFDSKPHGTDNIAGEKSDFNPEDTYARIELQTLTRLPQTRSILFSFKTYLYPITDIKDEGSGPDLADAIEGLKTGNAPGMWVYKDSGRWAGHVCKYLRS